MMNHIIIRLRARTRLLLTVLIACSFTGCINSDCDGLPAEQQSVAVKLALSVAKSTSPGATRMVSGNMTGTSVNIDLLYVIPFVVDEDKKVTIEDEFETTSSINGLTLKKSVDNNTFIGAFFTSSSCNFATGVNQLLTYGRDRGRSAGAAKGAIVETYGDCEPASIHFNLKSIKTKEDYLGTEEEKTIAVKLAEYLSAIANAKTDDDKTWKSDVSGDTEHSKNLKLLYKNFINELVTDGVGAPLPGSSANVYKWVTELQTQLNALTLTGTDVAIKNAIIAAIESNYSKVHPETGDWKNFPGSIGLPDGAAVVRWDGTAFVPETETTTLADINNIERFTYPAEIYYFANSPTMVSDNDLSNNFSSKNKWEKDKNNAEDTDFVLYGFTQGPVTGSTATVAMKDPLQYGVAKLQVQVLSSANKLPDANNTEETKVTVGSESFPLTGIIVGGQLPVGFDFRPESVSQIYSEAKMSFIYDNQLGTTPHLSTSTSTAVSTLVLQSYDEKNVKIVLEFENNSDKDFKGLDGTVYRGTKFYLVGEIQPKNVLGDAEPYDYRIFTQDYTTIININVTTLAKAYNVLPNLLSPRLEMGLELTPQWEKATPTDVVL